MFDVKDIKKHKRARVWINESPKVQYKFTEIIKENFNSNSYNCENKSITVEILLPRNSSYYGLLGASYISNNSGILNVEVMMNNLEEFLFKENIAPDFEDVWCGIPEEYCKSILKYIHNNIDNLIIPSGKLFFNIGAYGLIGSSSHIFSLLTKLILTILDLEIKNCEFDNIKNTVLQVI